MGGFDPRAFASGYREIKGQDIRCFNFGIDSSSAASTHAIARVMLEDYHPRLLIIGTDARDYVGEHVTPVLSGTDDCECLPSP